MSKIIPRSQEVISSSTSRNLNDKLYERRKLGALEIEQQVKQLQKSKDYSSIVAIIRCLRMDFIQSPSPNPRKGGLIAIAAISLGLGSDVNQFITEVVPPVIGCFSDPDHKVRYYACESLYNITKVSRGHVLRFFNEIFDSLCKMAADPDKGVKDGAELLDRLVKDVICEGHQFDIEKFIPLLSERVHITSTDCRRFLVGWIRLLDSVPDVELLQYLPHFLHGLFLMLSDKSEDIKRSVDTCLSQFLKEIKDAHAKWKTIENEISKLTIGNRNKEEKGNKLIKDKEESVSEKSDETTADNIEENGDADGVKDDLATPKEGEEKKGESSNEQNESDNSNVNTNAASSIEEEDLETDHSPPSINTMALKNAGLLSPRSLRGNARRSRGKADRITELDLQLIEKTSLAPLARRPPRLHFASTTKILITHTLSRDEFTALTSLHWLAEFIEMGQDKVLSLGARMLAGILPQISSRSKNIESKARAANFALHQLVKNTQLYFAVKEFIDAIMRQFKSPFVPTRLYSLRWILILHLKSPVQLLAYLEHLFPELLYMLEDPAEEVVRVDLQVLAKLSSNKQYFSQLMSSLCLRLKANPSLLEGRVMLIIRQLCLHIDPEKIYRELANLLVSEENLDFASKMIQRLNHILLTAPELTYLKQKLKSLGDDSSRELFICLYKSWCHNEAAVFSLCLLSQMYEHASSIIFKFAEYEISVTTLVEMDKLVQLLESPIFLFLRLQLLEYGLLMLLPQSDAFTSLQRRLNSIGNFSLMQMGLKQNMQHSPHLLVGASTSPMKMEENVSGTQAMITSGGVEGDVTSTDGADVEGRKVEIDFNVLLEHFHAFRCRHNDFVVKGRIAEEKKSSRIYSTSPKHPFTPYKRTSSNSKPQSRITSGASSSPGRSEEFVNISIPRTKMNMIDPQSGREKTPTKNNNDDNNIRPIVDKGPRPMKMISHFSGRIIPKGRVGRGTPKGRVGSNIPPQTRMISHFSGRDDIIEHEVPIALSSRFCSCCGLRLHISDTENYFECSTCSSFYICSSCESNPDILSDHYGGRHIFIKRYN